MAETSQSPLELRQTREFTTREKRDSLESWQRLYWRGHASLLYRTAYSAYYGFIVFAAISVLAAIKTIAEFDGVLAAQVAVSTVGLAAAYCLVQWQSGRMRSRRYNERQRLGDSYVLESGGIRSVYDRGIIFFPYESIEGLADNRWQLIISLPRGAAIFIIKAAFEGQDAAGFCAELTQRWHKLRSNGTQS